MTAPMRRYKLFIVAPTCFYYQVSLFRELAADSRFDLKVFFCSDEALKARDVLEMYHTDARRGDEEELLNGFDYQFLRNYSPRPSYLTWPFGLVNFGIWKEIRQQRPDAVVLMSWMNVTWWIAILASLIGKIPIFYLTDANVDGELVGPRWKRWVKKILLGKLLFPQISGFLCAGQANHDLYSHFGVQERKLVPFAYSWGYSPLLVSSITGTKHNEQLRAELGIPADSEVILYCGRLSSEKNLLHLLEAYSQVDSEKKALVFVGDGDLRGSLEEYVAQHRLESVHFVGFQNRDDIPKYYSFADLLVLPSRRETWGMVVNEAMCFGLPVIVSDQVGAGRDLVRDGYNGFRFPAGDINLLAQHIRHIVDMPDEERALMGQRSLEIITKWTQRDLCESLDEYLRLIHPDNRKRKAG